MSSDGAYPSGGHVFSLLEGCAFQQRDLLNDETKQSTG